jgi:hypothetical protein
MSIFQVHSLKLLANGATGATGATDNNFKGGGSRFYSACFEKIHHKYKNIFCFFVCPITVFSIRVSHIIINPQNFSLIMTFLTHVSLLFPFAFRMVE